MRINLGTKIILAIETIVIVLVVFALVTTYLSSQNVIKNEAYDHLMTVSKLKEQNVIGYIGDVTREIEWMKNNTQLHQLNLKYFKERSKADNKAIGLKISELLGDEKVFSEVNLFDKNGEVVFSTEPTAEGKIMSGEPFFQNAKQNTYLQTYYFDLGTLKPTMMISTPIVDAQKNFVGELNGRVNIDEISNIISDRTGLGATGETFMVNAFNLVVTELLKEPDAVMKKTLYLPQIKTCLNGESATYNLPDYHGDIVYGYYHWVPELKTCLLAKMDASEALKPLQNVLILLVAVLMSGGLLMGLIGLWVARTLVKPIMGLNDAMQKVKEGNLDVVSGVQSNDEIGDMANAFDGMTKQLKETYGGLEEKVKEKTKELEEKLTEMEKMNDLMVGRELMMVDLKKKVKETEKK